MRKVNKIYLLCGILQFIAITLLVALVPTLRYTQVQKSKFEHEVKGLEKDVAKMQLDIRALQSRETKLNNNFAVWRDLSHEHVCEESISTKDDLLKIMKKLSEEHRVSITTATVSKPLDVSGLYDKHHINVLRRRVIVEFNAPTDKDAVLFMHSIKYDVSGFIAVRFFEVVKNESKVADDRKEANAIGKIEFDLYKMIGQYI